VSVIPATPSSGGKHDPNGGKTGCNPTPTRSSPVEAAMKRVEQEYNLKLDFERKQQEKRKKEDDKEVADIDKRMKRRQSMCKKEEDKELANIEQGLRRRQSMHQPTKRRPKRNYDTKADAEFSSPCASSQSADAPRCGQSLEICNFERELAEEYGLPDGWLAKRTGKSTYWRNGVNGKVCKSEAEVEMQLGYLPDAMLVPVVLKGRATACAMRDPMSPAKSTPEAVVKAELGNEGLPGTPDREIVSCQDVQEEAQQEISAAPRQVVNSSWQKRRRRSSIQEVVQSLDEVYNVIDSVKREWERRHSLAPQTCTDVSEMGEVELEDQDHEAVNDEEYGSCAETDKDCTLSLNLENLEASEELAHRSEDEQSTESEQRRNGEAALIRARLLPSAEQRRIGEAALHRAKLLFKEVMEEKALETKERIRSMKMKRTGKTKKCRAEDDASDQASPRKETPKKQKVIDSREGWDSPDTAVSTTPSKEAQVQLEKICPESPRQGESLLQIIAKRMDSGRCLVNKGQLLRARIPTRIGS